MATVSAGVSDNSGADGSYRGGKIELRISSVGESCAFFCKACFFPLPPPRALTDVFTRIGLLYFTSECVPLMLLLQYSQADAVAVAASYAGMSLDENKYFDAQRWSPTCPELAVVYLHLLRDLHQCTALDRLFPRASSDQVASKMDTTVRAVLQLDRELANGPTPGGRSRP